MSAPKDNAKKSPYSVLLLFTILFSIGSISRVHGISFTYFAGDYGVVVGSHIAGSVPSSLQSVDSDYFVAQSSPSGTTFSVHGPSTCSLVGITAHVSGTANELLADDGVSMIFRSHAQSLYSHHETTTIGADTYYLLRTNAADYAGITLSASGEIVGRMLMGKFVYQLTGVSSVPASEWTIYYRACTSSPSSNLAVHGDVDILVRMANGTVRTTVARNVANSEPLTEFWSTLSGTYSWAAYTVASQTDYLEIDYYLEVTEGKSGQLVCLRIDDNTVQDQDQTRAGNDQSPDENTVEVEFSGSSNIYEWTQLIWSIDSAWTTDNVTVTLQLYNFMLGAYSTNGLGFTSYNSSATPNIDETRTQTITATPNHFRNATGHWKMKIKGVKTTATQFDFKADWVEFKPFYPEYTVSTEFLFSSMTTNTPSLLNFTVVSEYNRASVSVTIQVWNYSSFAYVTSGEGYQTYLSSGMNETRLLSINKNPQFYSSNGNAKVKVTGVLAASTEYEQEVNQVKLVYGCAEALLPPVDWATALLYALPPIFALVLLLGLFNRKKKTRTQVKKAEAFSQQFGMSHQQMMGKKMLLEINPKSDYQNALFNFVSEASRNSETSLIFTSMNSALHSGISRTKNVSFLLLSTKASNVQKISQVETLLPAVNLSIALDAIATAAKAQTDNNLNLLFDNLSVAVLMCGFEKTYKFMRFLLEAISSSKITALFVFNPGAHEPTVCSSIRGLFQFHLAYTKRGLKVESL